MNFSNFADQMLNFQHYEYIALPLFIILLVMFALQQAGFIKSSEDKILRDNNKSFRLKAIDLGLIVMMLIGCTILVLKKNPGLIEGQYIIIFSVILIFIKSIYDRIFQKEIEVIKGQHQNEILQQKILYPHRKRNIIIYFIFIIVLIIGFIFFGDGLFSDPSSTVILIFGAVILYVVGFIIVWNKE